MTSFPTTAAQSRPTGVSRASNANALGGTDHLFSQPQQGLGGLVGSSSNLQLHMNAVPTAPQIGSLQQESMTPFPLSTPTQLPRQPQAPDQAQSTQAQTQLGILQPRQQPQPQSQPQQPFQQLSNQLFQPQTPLSTNAFLQGLQPQYQQPPQHQQQVAQQQPPLQQQQQQQQQQQLAQLQQFSQPPPAEQKFQCDGCALEVIRTDIDQCGAPFRYLVCRHCVRFYKLALTKDEYRIHMNPSVCPVEKGLLAVRSCYGCLYQRLLAIGVRYARSSQPVPLEDPPVMPYQTAGVSHQLSADGRSHGQGQGDENPHKRHSARRRPKVSQPASPHPASATTSRAATPQPIRKGRGRPRKTQLAPFSSTPLTSLPDLSNRKPSFASMVPDVDDFDESDIYGYDKDKFPRGPYVGRIDGDQKKGFRSKRSALRGFCIGCWKIKELEERYPITMDNKFMLCNACRKTHLTKHVIPAYEKFSPHRTDNSHPIQRQLVRDELELLWTANNKDPTMFRLLDLWINIDWRRPIINGVCDTIGIGAFQKLIGSVLANLLPDSSHPPPIGLRSLRRKKTKPANSPAITEEETPPFDATTGKRPASAANAMDTVEDTAQQPTTVAAKTSSSHTGAKASEDHQTLSPTSAEPKSGTTTSATASSSSVVGADDVGASPSAEKTTATSRAVTSGTSGDVVAHEGTSAAGDGSSPMSNQGAGSGDVDAEEVGLDDDNDDDNDADDADGDDGKQIQYGEEMLRLVFVRVAGVIRPVVVPLIPFSMRKAARKALKTAIRGYLDDHIQRELHRQPALVDALHYHQLDPEKIVVHDEDITLLFSIVG